MSLSSGQVEIMQKETKDGIEQETSSSSPEGTLENDEKLVTSSNKFTISFSDLTHSLGSHEMNYSAGSLSVSTSTPSQRPTEKETVQLEFRTIVDSDAGVEPIGETFTEEQSDNNSKSFDGEESEVTPWKDAKEGGYASTGSTSETRRFSKIKYDPKISQQKRRERTLEWQRNRRDEILDKIRNLEGDSSYSDSEPESVDFFEFASQNPKENDQDQGETEAVEEMEEGVAANQKYRGRNWRRRISAPVTVMLSEWFIEKPEDFDEKWIGVLCPVGKRCVVIASRGKTRIYSRRDYYLGCYPSMLPGGRKDGYCVSGNRSRGVSILDCIWSESSQVFYVLDLICWNSHPCTNCDTDYRQFFLASKFQENEILLQRNRLNPFPFIPLPYFTTDNFTTIMTSSYPPFPENIDGIILLHRESFYISEVNPLCLWLRLNDVDRRIGISVSPELLAKQQPLRQRPPRVDKRKGQRSSKKSMDVVES